MTQITEAEIRAKLLQNGIDNFYVDEVYDAVLKDFVFRIIFSKSEAKKFLNFMGGLSHGTEKK